MKCSNTPSCWACRGSFFIYINQPVWLIGIDEVNGISLENEGKLLKMKSGLIHQPFNKSSFRLISGDDEGAEPFLSIPHDWVEKITDDNNELIWG